MPRSRPEGVEAAALFSGKDSIFAILQAERVGLHVKELISMVTTFGQPSPHMENLLALEKAAESMRKRLTIVDLRGGEGRLVSALRDSGAKVLVAGDVFVEDHVNWLEGVCRKAGMGVIEPLYGIGTKDILQEMLSEGFVVKIIGVDTRLLGDEWLGFTLSRENLDDFLEGIGNADPLGENGEYHTLVLDCPLYSRRLELRSSTVIQAGSLKYLRVEVA
ncbi:MAG: ATP pyrophosphatase [Candidatus Methanosuratincola petrocarbonis]